MNQPSFEWIDAYEALAKEVRKRDTPEGREELLAICSECLGKDDWTYIDPLAIFLSFNRSGKNSGQRRVQQIRALMDAFGITVPFDGDLSGIPTAYQQFGIISHNRNDAEKSWRLFDLVVDQGNAVLDDSEFIEAMNQVAALNGKVNFNDLTKILYMLNPHVFFPLHLANNALVKTRFGVDNQIIRHSAEGYVNYLHQLKEATDEAFWELSNSADPHFSDIPEQQESSEAPCNVSSRQGRNIILYGPPGTGKTHHVAATAWLIANGRDCSPCALRSLSHEDEEAAKAWYDGQLRQTNGQVAFTTFHQSFGYEEFIEGIRPLIADETSEGESELTYRYEDGIFKSFCKRAARPIVLGGAEDLGLNSNPNIWKVSLDGTGPNPTRTDCLENGHIRIGWDDYGPTITGEIDYKDGGKQILNYFVNVMRRGDIVLSCYSATTVDAIGVITGDPEWHEEYDRLKRQRAVKWLAKDLALDIVDEFNLPTMTLSTIYRSKMSVGDALKVIQEHNGGDSISEPNDKPYIFVIDEINRGNVSKIFGELITLIEESKREGQPEAQCTILPYTKETFSVPSNVTIIGTMNTADRSLTQLDTALRRRFEFLEIAPDPSLLSENIENIDLQKLLEAMNTRIAALYDREHLIGHSYLMGVDSFAELKNRFASRIIPLLQEYFYDDYEKIRLVLNDERDGDGFVVRDGRDERYLGNLGNLGNRDAPLTINDSTRWLPEHFMAIYGEALSAARSAETGEE